MIHAPASGYRKARARRDVIFRALCLISAIVGVLLLVALLYGILRDGAGRLNWAFLNNYASFRADQAGFKAAIWGSVWLIGLTGVIAVPVGVAAAIYLEEFAKKNRINIFIQLNIANLAGVPSIVYGLLGLAVFVRAMMLERTLIAGALTMSLLILPMIIITTQEALRTVPKSLREGSLALGATPWQTVVKQVVPAALPGILTGIILSLSRAMGETAPLVTIGALTFVRFTPTGLNSEFTAMPIQIFNWASRPRVEFHQVAAAGIIVLLAVLLTMNLVAILLRNKFQRRF